MGLSKKSKSTLIRQPLFLRTFMKIQSLPNQVKKIISRHKILSSILIGLLAINYLTLIVLKILPFDDLKTFQNHPVSTRIYDENNRLIQILPVEDGLRREWIDLKQIPNQVKKTILKAEDKRFYFHHGVDFFAILNAFRQNSQSDKTVRGASTITMQLAKMIYPSSGQSFSKKIQDILNAWRIEAKLSKKQILELYINNVPFGNNCEGFPSAARTFYSKELGDISQEELCCICVIPRRPSLYNPISNPEQNAQMAQFLYNKTSKKSDEASEKILMASKSASWYEYPHLMPHYINYIKTAYAHEISSRLPELHLAANLEIQQFAQGVLLQALEMAESSRISNGAVLVLNNRDGSVMAWVGNGNFYSEKNSGQIDGVLVDNQPGSSMKPFLYALSLEQKDSNGVPLFYPSMILPDIPKEFGSSNIYIPQNFNNRYNGPIRFRIALASSLNIPAVDLLNQIGVENYLDLLYKMGFDSLKPQAERVGLGLALGAGEVTLKELVPAFSVFTRDGKYMPLSYEHNKNVEEKAIYSSDTARVLCSILSDKGARALAFGYNQTFQTEYPSIFKTGTSNQYQNIVALGSTKDFTVGVWMGNFAGQTVIGKTGSSLPAWVAKQILDLLENHNQKSFEEKQFNKPEHYEFQRICSLSGLKAGRSCPASVQEYVPEGLELEACTWHRRIDGIDQVIYPGEYQQWLRIYNIDANVDFENSDLKIVTPKNDSVFFYSEMNKDLQAIPVELIGGYEEKATVEYDGEFYAEINQPFYFKLPVEPGTHNCKVYCGNQVEEINFVVK